MLRTTARSLFKRTAPVMCSGMNLPVTTLTGDEKMLVESVREFAKQKIAPITFQMDEDACMPKDLIDSCFENGLMGIETPSDLGGAGMSFFSSILAIEELARVDPAVSVMVDVQNTLVNNIFFRFANDKVRGEFLRCQVGVTALVPLLGTHLRKGK